MTAGIWAGKARAVVMLWVFGVKKESCSRDALECMQKNFSSGP
jgi:hypothetical protein